MNFTQIAKAILLFFQERNSLFAEQVLSKKLDEPLDVIRSEIQTLTGMEPEKLVMNLEPARVKRVIVETANNIKQGNMANPEVNIKVMTEEETEQGCKKLSIYYNFADTCFGPVIIASTTKGVCYLAFAR